MAVDCLVVAVGTADSMTNATVADSAREAVGTADSVTMLLMVPDK